MKLLTKAKIINWHYIWNQTIEFKQIVFLTGKNGSGKTTLIDALSLVLLGDTTGRYFNKAAMDKSNRTLKGYLRGEIGDTLEGDFKYLRNGKFTSYIALEFHDDFANSDFVMGIVFDSFADGTEEHHFFSFDDKIPENEFIVDKYPMDYKTLHAYLNEHEYGKYQFFDSNRQYQDFLKRKFGGLKDKYFNLFKKATSFSPITDITTFITEYVCDPQQTIELEGLQENIIQYKKLETEAEKLQLRISMLEDIKKQFDVYKSGQKNFQVASYIIQKCDYEISRDRLNSFRHSLLNNQKRLKEIDHELTENKKNLEELDRRKIALVRDKTDNDTVRITDQLREEKQKLEEDISAIEQKENTVKNNLDAYCDAYIRSSKELINHLKTFNFDFLDEDRAREIGELELGAKEIYQSASDFKKLYEGSLVNLNKELLDEFREKTSLFKNKISSLAISLARAITNTERKIASLREEEKSMKQGTKPYDYRLVEIKRRLEAELKNKFNKDIPVEIYADLIDINDLSWSNAVEGFLNNQKFNLFVAPKYYIEAYRSLKNLLDEYKFFGTSLVDQEKIIERDFECDPDSLAEEIITDHKGARAYTNFLIGRLHKSSNIEEARESGNGITKDCDLYRNFTFSRLNPRTYQNSYIGRTIDERFMKEKSKELANILMNLSSFKGLSSIITLANNVEVINSNEIANILEVIDNLTSLPGLVGNLDFINKELKEHDTSLIESIDRRLRAIEDDIDDINLNNERLLVEKGNLSSENINLEQEKIKNEITKSEELEKSLYENYEEGFVLEYCDPEIAKALDEGKTYLQIRQDTNVSIGRLQYLVNSFYTQLVKLRRDYCRDYHLSHDAESLSNDKFDQELVEFRDIKLPEYREKIKDSYNKATQQFKDEFIFKLRSAIEDVEDQINNLNLALVESSFGDDSYKFTCKPSQVYRRYYDMLKDDIILETGEDESKFIEKYHDVMEDLFRQIVDVGNGDKNSALLSNIEKFTDYRSYLDFDLIVKNLKTNEEQRLSKMIKKKSGGETQTPFYISVLASFAQLYHVHDEGIISNTVRLIFFDEAFSKMDKVRMVEAVKLLRKFDFQVIISTPEDNLANIGELVDETLIVSRNKNSSCVLPFTTVDK